MYKKYLRPIGIASTAILGVGIAFAQDSYSSYGDYQDSSYYAADRASNASTGSAAFINWSGYYFGGRIGAEFNNSSYDENYTNTVDTNGIGIGAFVGYNHQLDGPIVVGAEIDVAYTFAQAKLEGFGDPEHVMNYGISGGVMGRVGFAYKNLLFYMGLGAKIQSQSFKAADKSDSDYGIGWMAALGVDVALNENIFIRLEYDYSNVGKYTFKLDEGHNVWTNGHGISIGIATHF